MSTWKFDIAPPPAEKAAAICAREPAGVRRMMPRLLPSSTGCTAPALVAAPVPAPAAGARAEGTPLRVRPGFQTLRFKHNSLNLFFHTNDFLEPSLPDPEFQQILVLSKPRHFQVSIRCFTTQEIVAIGPS